MNFTASEGMPSHAETIHADKTFVAALRGAKAGLRIAVPRDLVWGSDTKTNHHDPRYEISRNQRAEMAEPLRTYRDPCGYCGTRRDMGCSHYPVAA